ncbi:MAG: T9SS type A sorting domain-containing protein [Bacteroidota bacterium]
MMLFRHSLLAAAVALMALPTSAQTLSDAVRAYVWADQESSDSYTPDPDYAYNASGEAITLIRSGVGRYQALFAGLGAVSGTGTIHVTAYRSNASCVVAGWGSNDGALDADVRCYDPSGALTDSRFMLLFATASGITVSNMAYAWADQSEAASYTPEAFYAYNGGGGAITASRSSTGTYEIEFAGLSAGTGLGHIQVTAYGSDALCRILTWNVVSGSVVVGVGCQDSSGDPVDSRYTVLYVGADAASANTGFAWADARTSSSYAPSSSYVFNDTRDVTATRSSPGVYGITFAGLGGTTEGGHVQVSSYGASNFGAVCNTNRWDSVGDVEIDVECYDENGTLVDSRYTVLVVWPDRVPVSTDGQPDDAFSLTAFPNPTTGAASVRFTLDAPTPVRLTVYDALGREVARLAEGTRRAGEHTESLDTSSLPSGLYRIRLAAGGHVVTQTLSVIR